MEELSLYPLKFMPLFKNKIWGGNKIKNSLGIDYDPLPNCGEMWILSGVEGNESVVENGFLAENNLNEVLEIYMADLVGEVNYQRFGDEFPILIKIIDAVDKLSIQVHPDNALARKRGLQNGKTEMWYIMDSEKDSTIIDGFSKLLNKNTYQKALDNNTLVDNLHVEYPQKGDVFFIPGGRVHALGKGLLLAEIQQTSDTTYRIFDWNRVDKDGKSRELHTAEALDAIDFSVITNGKSEYSYHKNSTVELAQCPYFTTNLIAFDKPIRKNFEELDSFVAYCCTEGICAVKSMGHIIPMRAGECVLIPAVADIVELFPEGEAKLLEIYIEGEEGVEVSADNHEHCGCEDHHHHDGHCGCEDHHHHDGHCGCGGHHNHCDC